MFTFGPWMIFASGSDIPGVPAVVIAPCVACLAGCCASPVPVSRACQCCWAGVSVLVRGASCGLRRCCHKAGQGSAAPAAGPGREAGGGAAGVVFLASVPWGGDARVAGDGQAGGEQQPGGQAHDPAPAAGDVVGGGVLEGGEDAFGAGAPVIGAAVRGGGVVVFLRGLGQDVRGGGRVLGRGEDLGPVPVQGE